ncbi:MAG: hypothetical protein Fur0037_22180 [Planctomycetota bacterium]
MNYWENDAKTGRPRGRTSWELGAVEKREDGGARVVLELSYGAEEQRPVLAERRVIEVGAPAADGSFAIDWDMTFTALEDCVLDRTPPPGEPGGRIYGGYAGLSLRLANIDDRRAVTGEGDVAWNEHSRFRGRAPAFEYDGRLGGREVGVAILSHPGNGPSPWYATRTKEMTFFSHAVLCEGPRRLSRGERLVLRYRVLVHPGRWDPARLGEALESYTAPNR